MKVDLAKSILNRREFLGNLSKIVGASVFLSSLPWLKVFGNKTDGFVSTVKIAVIGTGSRGGYHLNLLKNIPGVEVVAVCDNYDPHLENGIAITDGKAKGYNDYKKVIEQKEIQGVIIATPLDQHAHITIDALKAGKNVMCEKSMARTYQDCFSMVKAQEETEKILMIGHQRMYDIKYLDGIERIHRGELGKITQIKAFWHRNNDWRRQVPSPELEQQINWRLYRKYSAGLMTELASHQIQVANWILKSIPKSVMGSGSINFWKDGREVYDNVNLIYNYKNGVKLIYDSLTSNKHYGLEEQIQGNLGTMELEKNKYFSEEPPPAPGILQLVNNIEHGIFDAVPIGGASWVPETAADLDGDPIYEDDPDGDGTDVLLEAFVESVRKNHVDKEIIRQGYFATISALMGEQAMDTQQTVYFPEEFKI